MALKLTPQDIEKFVDRIKKFEPYSREELNQIPLDAPLNEFNEGRIASARAKRILDGYFKEHPEEDVYGYLDGSCFNSK